MSRIQTSTVFVTAVAAKFIGLERSVYKLRFGQRISHGIPKRQRLRPSPQHVSDARLEHGRTAVMSSGKGYQQKSTVNEKADVIKIVTIATVSAAVLYYHNLGVILYAVGSILNVLIAKALKRIIRQPRPDGATKIDHGMPSSHATSLSFLTVAALFGAVRQAGGLRPTPLLGVAVLALLLAIVATRWRIAAGYHTTPQVAAGWIIGSLDAILWFFLIVPAISPLLTKLL